MWSIRPATLPRGILASSRSGCPNGCAISSPDPNAKATTNASTIARYREFCLITLVLQGACPPASRPSNIMLLLAVGFELGEVRPEIADLFFIFDAGEQHLRTGNFRARVLDVFLETGRVP